MKMPSDLSIYWDSVDSQRSTSGSSGDASSGSRQYVDPWDLENYAYLRRHSVAGVPQQAPRRQRSTSHGRLSQDSRAQSEYWYSSAVREPGYDAPAFVEELYCGPQRPNNSCYYHQPIYEDEVPDYVAPFPVYAPLSESRHAEEDPRRSRQRFKSASVRELQRAEYIDPRTPTEATQIDDRYHHEREHRSLSISPEDERFTVQMIPPPHLDLNTYGHLKIDYTNSWNSLNRKISK